MVFLHATGATALDGPCLILSQFTLAFAAGPWCFPTGAAPTNLYQYLNPGLTIITHVPALNLCLFACDFALPGPDLPVS